MLPEELYKSRRNHNNTPKSTLLIFTNYIVVLVSSSLCTSCDSINWFFWVILAGLLVYNVFTLRRFHEEYNKPTIIAYIISLIVLVGLFIGIVFKGNC